MRLVFLSTIEVIQNTLRCDVQHRFVKAILCLFVALLDVGREAAPGRVGQRKNTRRFCKKFIILTRHLLDPRRRLLL